MLLTSIVLILQHLFQIYKIYALLHRANLSKFRKHLAILQFLQMLNVRQNLLKLINYYPNSAKYGSSFGGVVAQISPASGKFCQIRVYSTRKLM